MYYSLTANVCITVMYSFELSQISFPSASIVNMISSV